MPAGWYPDQQDPSLLRFWDGERWTLHTQPVPPTGAPEVVAEATSPGMRDRWRALRLRTKVLSIVAILVVFIALAPSPDDDPSDPGAAASTSDTTELAEELTDEAVEPAKPERAVVPSLRAVGLEAARGRLRKAGLAVRVVREPSWKPAGSVLAQRTAAGAKVRPGTTITLVVAAPMPLIPILAGRSQADGVAALRRAGFTVSVVKEVVTSGSSGVILRLFPVGGTRAAPGTEVEVVVSNLVRPVAAPPTPSNCTSGYSPCLAPAPDYDCAGGSGDGPRYTGLVYVTGSDPYGLDADGDGVACES